ncbi:MAG TPA: NosD domain-containing protein [Planctomycetota bacterium]|nr:NosD domain-containing protein [Planctomycetota bacterium]
MLPQRCLALVLAAVAASADAADRWVAPGGDDATGTGAAGSPFRQIRRALQGIAPGDTVHVADGTYLGFDVTVSGTAGARIVVQGTGSNAVITATTDRADNRDTIHLVAVSYVTIANLRSFNAPRSGLRVEAGNHVHVRGCTFGDNQRWGIFTGFSNDLVIEENECYGSVIEHGIYVSNSGDRPTVRGNRLHHNHANGLHVNGDRFTTSPPLPSEGIITGALIERNVIWENGAGGGSGINCDGVQDSVIRGNLVYAARSAGITLYRIDGGGASTGNRVIANTVEVGAGGRWCLQLHNGADHTVVFDNILISRHASRGSISLEGGTNGATIASDHNILDATAATDGSTFANLATWQAQGHDANSFVAARGDLFVDPDAGDYRLKAASPALDQGISSFGGATAPTADLSDPAVARPSGAAYDIGAYEGLASGSTPSGTTGGSSGTGTGGGTAGGSSGGGGGSCGLGGGGAIAVAGLVLLFARRRC